MSTPQLPAGLPELPPGAVYDGMGDESNTTWDDYWCFISGDKLGWIFGQYKKTCPHAHYARKAKPAADSEAVALVRKLADALKLAHAILAKISPNTVDAAHARSAVKYTGDGDAIEWVKSVHSEAAAFLAKEETKS